LGRFAFLEDMTDYTFRFPGWIYRAALVAVLIAAAAACAGKKPLVPANVAEPDRYLLDLANAAVMKEDWLKAREYYRQVVDNYPQSPVRPDAKLGIGDTYLGDGSAESLVLATAEYREFLTFYPTNPRADYAQYKLAMSHFKQMRAPERDQTETKAALAEFENFFERYPNSPLTTEVRNDWRIARDRLSEASYRIGLHYYRSRWYPGAVDRFREVLKDDPNYSHRDDVYFYLAECYAKSNRKAEAIPYLERLLAEYTASEHLDEARRRLQELQAAPAAAPAKAQ
jgi:outer membrane protein assembly factor BamD